jgi:hypothetical protein
VVDRDGINDGGMGVISIIIYYLCIVEANTMAKPIKNTPVLKGKDLIAFHEELEKSENISVADRKKERERVAKSAKRLMQSLTFMF